MIVTPHNNKESIPQTKTKHNRIITLTYVRNYDILHTYVRQYKTEQEREVKSLMKTIQDLKELVSTLEEVMKITKGKELEELKKIVAISYCSIDTMISDWNDWRRETGIYGKTKAAQ